MKYSPFSSVVQPKPVRLTLDRLEAEYLYALLAVHLDHLVGTRNHSDLCPDDQTAHIVLGSIEAKLCPHLDFEEVL